MWHWNSLWARAPGDPPTIDDPTLWQNPWSAEQAMALQARGWEAMLSATHAWWSYLFSMWPLPTWPAVGELTPPTAALFAQPARAGAPETPAPASGEASAPPRKRAARPVTRQTQAAHKR